MNAPPPKPGMSAYKKALLWTAVPISAISLLSTGGGAGTAVEGLYFAWYFAGLVWILGFFAIVGFGIAGKSEIAAGIAAGIGIGALALFVSCFANLSTVDWTSIEHRGPVTNMAAAQSVHSSTAS